MVLAGEDTQKTAEELQQDGGTRLAACGREAWKILHGHAPPQHKRPLEERVQAGGGGDNARRVSRQQQKPHAQQRRRAEHRVLLRGTGGGTGRAAICYGQGIDACHDSQTPSLQKV